MGNNPYANIPIRRYPLFDRAKQRVAAAFGWDNPPILYELIGIRENENESVGSHADGQRDISQQDRDVVFGGTQDPKRNFHLGNDDQG